MRRETKPMGDMGDTFRAMREDSKERRAHNLESSIALLEAQKVPFRRLSDTHLRVALKFDFWPSTGKWCRVGSNRYGRGVLNLLCAIESDHRERTRKDNEAKTTGES